MKLVMATCHAEGCHQAEEPIPCGDPEPNIYCGGCGVEIMDKVEAVIPSE